MNLWVTSCDLQPFFVVGESVLRKWTLVSTHDWTLVRFPITIYACTCGHWCAHVIGVLPNLWSGSCAANYPDAKGTERMKIWKGETATAASLERQSDQRSGCSPTLYLPILTSKNRFRNCLRVIYSKMQHNEILQWILVLCSTGISWVWYRDMYV